MSVRARVLELVELSPTPITSKQIADALNVRIETVASVLTEAWKAKLVKRRGAERDGERGGRLYEYVHGTATLDGFESLVLPLAKKTARRKARVTTASLPQAETIVATVSVPVAGKSVTFTVREARQLHEQLSALFGHVAHPAA